MSEKKNKKKNTQKKKLTKKDLFPARTDWGRLFLDRNKDLAYINDIKFGQINAGLLILVIALLVFGIVMMYSSSYAWAIHDEGDSDFYFKKQIGFALFGCGVMVIASLNFADYHYYTASGWFSNLIYIVALILMVITRIAGNEEGGSTRWLSIGGINVQTSEILKLATIIITARILAQGEKIIKTRVWNNTFILWLIILVVSVAAMLIQPHLSGTVIIGLIMFIMLIDSGEHPGMIIGIGIAGFVGVVAIGYFLAYVIHYGNIEPRMVSWLQTWDADNRDVAWQTRNSIIAIGSGGWFGLGLGNSRQKFLYLPESHNDFIFSIICEELGFIGGLTIILMFVMFILIGLRIADKAPDRFGKFLATGITAQIGLQALLNIGVVSNTFPNTGISLPFFSYGGSALIVQLAEVGILLNISSQSLAGNEQKKSREQIRIDHSKKVLGYVPEKTKNR